MDRSQPADTDQPHTVRIEWRGRDIALVPPDALWPLDDAALYAALFGDESAGQASALVRRDPRARVLRARPLDFTRLKAALAGWDVVVAFDERPALPWPVSVTLSPRPYQEDALTAWRAESCRGVVVLPTGSGKTLVG
ncbi:MAG TPA: DEAD/DEAH box helicase family protein, partial [Ktedonobacterales bacterium]|nr:DEAD/DEAH box helicase family protein [Ktedonobacterales bacterium]